MPTTVRRARALAAVCTAGAVLVAGLTAAAPSAQAVTGHPAGVVGSTIKLATGQFSGYDVGASPAGTAYIGWISSTATSTDRKVHLCKLPLGATTCTGGVQTIASLGASSAAGLQVIVDANDVVHLLWFHDTDQSINGPFNGAIAEATAVHGQNLTAAQDIVNAPSFGQLLTAELAPGGAIWTVSYAGVPSQTVYVWHTAAPGSDNVHTPFGVGYAQLAFTGGTPVLAIEKYGSIATGPYFATRSSAGTWSSFTALPHTWAVGTNAALETTRGHGLRIVTAINNASYRPVIAKWTGSGFTPRALTIDKNSCAPSTHDGWADASGRLLDVSWECHAVTVTNYADAFHAAIVRFNVANTPTGAPQIASGTRGVATVVYSFQTDTGTANVLRAARVRLPDSTHTVRHSGAGGRVTVTGPRSCLPPVNVRIGWTHRPASGWTFMSGALRLNGNVVSGTTLDGFRLTPGRQYTLAGSATFAKGGSRSSVRASLTFTTCAAG
jgi:hypothetical protein